MVCLNTFYNMFYYLQHKSVKGKEAANQLLAELDKLEHDLDSKSVKSSGSKRSISTATRYTTHIVNHSKFALSLFHVFFLNFFIHLRVQELTQV